MVYHRLRRQNVPLSLTCGVQSDHGALRVALMSVARVSGIIATTSSIVEEQLKERQELIT